MLPNTCGYWNQFILPFETAFCCIAPLFTIRAWQWDWMSVRLSVSVSVTCRNTTAAALILSHSFFQSLLFSTPLTLSSYMSSHSTTIAAYFMWAPVIRCERVSGIMCFSLQFKVWNTNTFLSGHSEYTYNKRSTPSCILIYSFDAIKLSLLYMNETIVGFLHAFQYLYHNFGSFISRSLHFNVYTTSHWIYHNLSV